jgi:tetratricopeptide (TPR) repeat protein
VGEIVRRELARSPQDAAALSLLAAVCARYGLYLPEALEAARRAITLSPRTAGFLPTLADVYLRMGNLEKAIEADSSAIAIDPTLTIGIIEQVARAVRQDEAAGRPELTRRERRRGEEALRRLLVRTRKDAETFNLVAWTCAMNDLYLPEALEAARRAVALRPGNTYNLDTLAEVQFRMGRADQAIATETRALALAPSNQSLKHQIERFRKGKK